MGGEAVCSGRVGRLFHASDRLDDAVLGVLETDDLGAGEMGILGFHGVGDRGGVGESIGQHRHDLRLDAAEHGSATALPAVAVGLVADDVLVASAAVAHQREQVRLGAARNEDRCLLVQPLGHHRLEALHGGIVAEHVVAERGVDHGLLHRSGRAGDGVRAEIDHRCSLTACGWFAAAVDSFTRDRRAG